MIGDPKAALLGAVVMAAAQVCALLPARVADGLARIGGEVEHTLRPAKRRRLGENLAHAAGLAAGDAAVRRLVRRNVVTGARRAAGSLWAFARPVAAAARVRVEPAERLGELISGGRGAILATPHLGAFEAVACVAHALPSGVRLAVLADDSLVSRAMAGVRRRMGVTVVPVPGPPRRAVELLRGGHLVVLVADLHRPGMRGHRVRLLDGTCELPGGPAALARLSGSPLVPFVALPDGPRRWRVRLDQPIPAPAPASGREGERAATQTVADAFSAAIRAHPEQWDAVDPIPWAGAP